MQILFYLFSRTKLPFENEIDLAGGIFAILGHLSGAHSYNIAVTSRKFYNHNGSGKPYAIVAIPSGIKQRYATRRYDSYHRATDKGLLAFSFTIVCSSLVNSSCYILSYYVRGHQSFSVHHIDGIYVAGSYR